MYSCSFFGDIKEEEMSPVFEAALYGALEFLIKEKDVDMFYSAAGTDFDRICEDMIFNLQVSYPQIMIMRIAAKDYKFSAEDSEFNGVVSLKTNSYIKRCKFISERSDYIIFDTVSDGIGLEIFVERLLGTHPKGIFDISSIVRKHKRKAEM